MIEYSEISTDSRAFKTVIVGSGKSILGFNLNELNRDDIFVITVNESGKYAPFADAWFTLDPWGLNGPQLPGPHFKGELYAAVPEDFGDPLAKSRDHQIDPPRNIKYLKRVSDRGFSEIPDTIHTGNSGFGAFNLAFLLGAKHILMLGIDGGRGYFYEPLKYTRNLKHLPLMFERCLGQIQRHGLKVFNGSPQSKITCFTRYEPEYAFERFINEPS
jgi:hypothetical protein